MKRKFSSMGRVAIALVLALSLVLVMAAPVAADTPADTDVGFVFGLGHSSDEAEWSTDKAGETGAMGDYSVKLVKSANAGTTVIDFIPVPGTTVSDLATIGDTDFWYWYDYGTSGGPGIELQFTMPNYDPGSDDGHVDVSVQAGAYGSNNPSGELLLEQWANENTIINDTAFYYGWDPVDGDMFFFDNTGGAPEVRKTLADMLALIDAETEMTEHGSSAADWELTRVRIELYGATARTCYIDDITVDGVTYELEPIFMDAEYYSVGDTVEVTVPNFKANTDSFRINPTTAEEEGTDAAWWQVIVTSDSDPETSITVALEETGANTGVFTASFGTSGTPPVEEDEVYVEDGATITVTYGGSVLLQVDWGAGEDDVVTTLDVLVDDTAPTIGTLLPGDGTIEYTTEPVISAILSDASSGIDVDSIVMKVNGVVVTTVDTGTTEAITATYTVSPELAAGDIVEVTVDVNDLAGNAADTASWSFSIASALNAIASPASYVAGTAQALEVTITDVVEAGPDGGGGGSLNWVKVEVSAPLGQSLATEEYYWDGAAQELGDADAGTATTVTFNDLLPNDASSDITVTVTGQLDTDDEAVGPVTLTIPVSGFVVEETWADVNLDSTDDISMTVTTKAGAAVNTGIVTITAAAEGGFEKDVDDDGELDSFQVIVIDGSASVITYGGGDPEDFEVMNGYYEVTGIKFAALGAVDVLVQTGTVNMARFPVAYSVLGNEVYSFTSLPAILTAGVDHASLEITVTEAGEPVTDVATITISEMTSSPFDVSGQEPTDGVYTIDPDLVSEAKTLDVLAKNADDTKYGTATLEVALPTVISDTEIMLTGEVEYTVGVSVTDALGEALEANLWIGTYDEEEEEFTAILDEVIDPDLPLALDAEGAGEFDITTGTEEASLVWKVGSGAAIAEAALILTPAIAVEDLYYDLSPTEVTVAEETIYTVTDNYGAVTGNLDVKIVTPGGDVDNKVTTPLGIFMYTASEAGDYYVSVMVDETWQDPITVTANGEVEVTLESIAAEPSEVTLDVGDTRDLTITATYSDETDADVTADATYVSSDETVVTVDAGVITGVALGDATITVTYTEAEITKTALVSVTVSVFDALEDYDADEDGAISKPEALTSVTDYFSGDITKAQALEVIALYFSS